MTHAPARNGTGTRRAFRNAATEPGLFDRPDRALAVLRSLAADTYTRDSDRITRLADLLRVETDTRFWTEESMREFVTLTNEVLDEVGRRLQLADSTPVRLGVKSSNRPSGRYTLFRVRSRPDGADICRRNFPSGLSLSEGPT